MGQTLLTRTHYLEAAERIRQMGAESVVLTLGSRGAVGAFADGLMEALPPRIDAVCPIGAGDALMAAYAWARERQNQCGGRAALGRGRGNRLGPPAGHELRQPGADPGNLPPGGSPARGIAPASRMLHFDKECSPT